MYNMYLVWDTKIIWVFKTWMTQDYAPFIFACFITFLISAISVGYGTIKKNILQKNDGKLIKTLIFFFGYLTKIIIMLLMMTMSVWANLAIALGTAFGFIIFQNLRRRKIKKQQFFQ